MTQDLTTILDRQGAPALTFWEHDLEIPVEHVWSRAAAPGYAEAWLQTRTSLQKGILARNLAASGVAVANGACDALAPYFLLQEFARYRSKAALSDCARRVLSHTLLANCEKRNGEFDPLALCFAMYGADPAELPAVLCMDKVHRSGFARMRLFEKLRGPARPFREFLSPAAVQEALLAFDQASWKARPSRLYRLIGTEDSQRVFIRRPERPGKVLRAGSLVHGYRPEWIVLEFSEGGKRVNIASASIEESLDVANRIASAYFGVACRYENENLVTYRQQLRRLLQLLQAGRSPELQLVEIAVANSPLEGAPKLKISDPQALSIGPAILHLEQSVGDILTEIERIESIKVVFGQKRLTILFERLEGTDEEFLVRYSDHRLGVSERKRFEEYLRQTHGISMLSTEQRFQHAA